MTQRAKIEIITSPTCPNCPPAKNAVAKFSLDRDDVKVVELSTATQKGSKRARSLDVRSVPTLIITGPGTDERIGYVGIPTQDQLNRMVSIAKGTENWEQEQPKENIVSRFMKRIKTGL
jgi:predicted DsbA family dithiol-disulfide isomerase